MKPRIHGTISVHGRGGSALLLLIALTWWLLGTAAGAQTYAVGVSSLVEGPSAGVDSVVLTVTPASGTWSGAANDLWLHVSAESASGTGSANVLFSFDANSGATRAGSLTIAGQTLSVTQAGSTYVAAGSVTGLVVTALHIPDGVAVDGSGNVYIADTYNQAIKKWTTSTQTLTTLVSSGLLYPVGVAVDGYGNVYFSDSGNRAIKEWVAATGSVATLVSSGLSNPEGVAVDGSGNVYIADSNASVIKKWTASTGTVTTLISSGLSYAQWVAADQFGNLYISDFDDYAIKKWTAATQTLSTLVSTGTSTPAGIAVDGSGNVYFSNLGNNSNAIEEWTASTQTVTALVSTGLNDPIGVAVDGFGNVYIADTYNNALKEWTISTQTVATLVPGVLNVPQAVAVDNSGNLYIADSSDSAIKEWMAANNSVAPLISSGLRDPAGVAVDGAGNVYIADAGNGAIEKWDAASETVTTLVSAASGLDDPEGVAVDGFGNVYYSDTGNQKIWKWTAATGMAAPLVSSGLGYPAGVAVDASGNVYIADYGNNTIEEWTASTQTLSTLVAGLWEPYGVAVDGSGNVYIADSNNNAIKEWVAATGNVNVLDSTGLYYPQGVAVDGVGNLYFADSDHNAVDELPRVFVDPTGKSEPATAGSDSLPAVLPATENLLPPFEPSSDQSWLTITGVSAGVVSFSFSGNYGSTRIGHISLLGQSIAVTQPAANPTAADYVAYLSGASPVTIDVLADDTAPAGLSLTVVSVTRPSMGRVKINADNTVTYTPNASFATFAGADSFAYTISDGMGGMASATVTIRNPFYTITGNYDELLEYLSGSNPNDASGYLALSLTGTGAFTGTLKLAGASYSFIGLFNENGTASVAIERKGLPSITLALALDMATGANIAGTISAGSTEYTVSTGARDGYDAVHPAPSAGTYTALLPAPEAPSGTTATASVVVSGGKITGLSVTDGGSGYVAAPGVVIAGGHGAGATALASISGGAVTSIAVEKPGHGYPTTGTTATIDPPSAGLPQGTGWARMAVSTSGAVTVAGKLGDGTAFSAGAFVHHGTNDNFAFYAPLYSGLSKPDAPGGIVGTITFEDLVGSDCDGALAWTKPAQTTGALYESGFSTSVDFSGARYASPLGEQALQFSNTTAGAATFGLSDGNLSTTLTNSLSISNMNVVTVLAPSTDKLKLTITAKTGLFAGSFEANSGKPAKSTTVTGILYQKTNVGAGLFLGPSQTGSALLKPQ